MCENEQDFKNIIIQIFYALNIASKSLKFTHYDLSMNNIIIQDLGRSKTLKYQAKIIVSRYVPVFIDYGLSHIKINDTDIGVDIKYYNVYNKSFPIYDIYFLLFTLYYKMTIDLYHKDIKDNVSAIYRYTRRLLKYFINDIPKTGPARTKYSERLSTYTLDDFIEYSENV